MQNELICITETKSYSQDTTQLRSNFILDKKNCEHDKLF